MADEDFKGGVNVILTLYDAQLALIKFDLFQSVWCARLPLLSQKIFSTQSSFLDQAPVF